MKTLLILTSLALASCATDYGTATPGWWKPSTPVDPQAQFGLLIEAAEGTIYEGPEIIPVK